MASVADARYVYNSRYSSWARAGDQKSTTTTYKIYDDGVDSITNIQICYGKSSRTFGRMQLSFSNKNTRNVIKKQAPSSKVVKVDSTYTCKSVISPRYSDCITKVTQGYNSINGTYTYMKFYTGAGRTGSAGRSSSKMTIKSFSTTKKTCLRGIFFNAIKVARFNKYYVGKMGYYFDTKLGARVVTTSSGEPLSPGVAAAIVVVFCCCICLCVGYACYQQAMQTKEAVEEVVEIVEEAEKPAETAPHPAGPPPAYPPGQGQPYGGAPPAYPPGQQPGYPGQMMPQQPMMGGMMQQAHHTTTTTTTTQNQQMMQQM